MAHQKILYTAGLVVVRDNKLLLAYSSHKNAWYLPGGKLEKGELPKEALIREIAEELSLQLDADKLKYLSHTTALAYGENPPAMMEQECYLYDLQEEIHASHEIKAVRFFDRSDYAKEPVQVQGVLIIFKTLEDKGLISREA